jgi:hypothetical protein
VENPFFRESKQQLGLCNFHTRNYQALKAHLYLTFLAYTLMTVMKSVKRISSKSIGEIKQQFIQIKAVVKRIAGTITLITNQKRPWLFPLKSSLKSPPY